MFSAASRPLLRIAARAPAVRSPLHRHAGFFTISTDLHSKIDGFKRDIEQYLPKDGKNVVFSTAWLATDNVFVALMREHFPEVLSGMHLVAIDTLHLFPETLECAKLVQDKYGKQASWWLPKGISTQEEFVALYGDIEDEIIDEVERKDAQKEEAFKRALNDFAEASKVEPFTRAMRECSKDILVTGRRMDQAGERLKLPVWEEDERKLNPMARFSWQDIITYADAHGVPVNRGHNYAFRCAEPIEATKRHLPGLPWTKVDLGKPFWQVTDAELKGTPPAPFTYVFKSFGDTHSTVPVEPHESERAGRFVREFGTECGIHSKKQV